MKTRNGLFADVPENLWNDWHWQVANRAETIEDLKKYMTLTPDEEAGVAKTLGKLRMAVTPYYLSLIDLNDPFDPIRKMAIPRAEELEYADYEDADPLHEDTDSPTPGLTHRYPDRVLLLITDQCSMYCRHCTRRRFAGQNDCEVPMQQIDKCIDYVAAHPEVRDVLLSGGDSLMVEDDTLEYIIKRVRAIPHVEIVRLGSRTPVVCPQRITPELCAMLKKYHPVWLNTHFNTPKEFTPEAAKACAMLADAGIPLGNQSVLLAGVNDCSHVMMELVHGLVKMRVRPYYIYACDPSLPHSRVQGHRDHGSSARPYLRLLHPHLRGGRPRRRRQDPCHAQLPDLRDSPQGHPAQLRGRHHLLYPARTLRAGLPLRCLHRQEEGGEDRRGMGRRGHEAALSGAHQAAA